MEQKEKNKKQKNKKDNIFCDDPECEIKFNHIHNENAI